MKKLLATSILWGIATVNAATPSNNGIADSASPDMATVRAKLDSDIQAVGIYRAGLQSIVSYTEQRSDLFPAAAPKMPRLLTESEKSDLRVTWQRLSEYYLALGSIDSYYRDAYKFKGDTKAESLGLGYAAFTCEYSYALKLIAIFERVPEGAKLLNEPMPELGVAKNSYAQFKFHYLHVQRATEFAARTVVFNASGKAPAGLANGIADDSKAIWQAGRGDGQILTLQNGLDILKSSGHTVWFPVQAGVSEWMGDAKVHRTQRSLISAAQIQSLLSRMQPGDILLERREWYLSNIGLPGFWPHGALYVGTPEERRAYFDDLELQQWVKAQGQLDGDFEVLLRNRYPLAYQLSTAAQHSTPRIIEAVSEGVIFNTLEHSADADALAVLRPRLSKIEKASAILRSFQYSGRPYDFDFDFQTDAALVCTELVYKSYEPKPPLLGVRLPTITMLGRVTMPANLIVKQFDAEYGMPAQQMDLVAFLDGREKQKVAVESNVGEFRKSWQRPKWHIFIQETVQDTAH